jgi:flagellar basal-body rod protein FlgB
MDYSKLTLFSMMQTKMAYHSQRQDSLAQNIANADTPGARAKDVKPLDFSRMMRKQQKLAMAQTSGVHKEGIAYRLPDYQAEQSKKTFEMKPVKNTINVEEQMMQISQNAFDFQTTTTMYRKTADLFKIALTNK